MLMQASSPKNMDANTEPMTIRRTINVLAAATINKYIYLEVRFTKSRWDSFNVASGPDMDVRVMANLSRFRQNKYTAHTPVMV